MSNQTRNLAKRSFANDRQLLLEARAVLVEYLAVDDGKHPGATDSLVELITGLGRWAASLERHAEEQGREAKPH